MRDRLLKTHARKITKKMKNEIIQNSYIVENISEELGDLPDPEKVVPDLKGYWIKKKLYKDMVNIDKWVTKLKSLFKIKG